MSTSTRGHCGSAAVFNGPGESCANCPPRPGGSPNRALPLFVVQVLREHRDRQADDRERAWHWEDTPYVFTSTVGTPIEPRMLTRTFHALCKRHGLRRVRLHDLRHSCMSLLLALGVSPRVVTEIVGHSAIEMTMNVYGHVSLDNQRAALDLLNAQLVADDEGTR
jgi:integrase